MVAKWVQLPDSSILKERGEPYLIRTSGLVDLRNYFRAGGATVVEVNIGAAQGLVEVVGALQNVLTFPEWCGSSWDSIHDALAEFRETWPFPLVVVVDGLPRLLVENPHLALDSVLGLSRLCEAFSIAGDQVLVFYVGERWGQ
jgi:hypothetical protein